MRYVNIFPGTEPKSEEDAIARRQQRLLTSVIGIWTGLVLQHKLRTSYTSRAIWTVWRSRVAKRAEHFMRQRKSNGRSQWERGVGIPSPSPSQYAKSCMPAFPKISYPYPDIADRTASTSIHKLYYRSRCLFYPLRCKVMSR